MYMHMQYTIHAGTRVYSTRTCSIHGNPNYTIPGTFVHVQCTVHSHVHTTVHVHVHVYTHAVYGGKTMILKVYFAYCTQTQTLNHARMHTRTHMYLCMRNIPMYICTPTPTQSHMLTHRWSTLQTVSRRLPVSSPSL